MKDEEGWHRKYNTHAVKPNTGFVPPASRPVRKRCIRIIRRRLCLRGDMSSASSTSACGSGESMVGVGVDKSGDTVDSDGANDSEEPDRAGGIAKCDAGPGPGPSHG